MRLLAFAVGLTVVASRIAGAQVDLRPDHPGSWTWRSMAARAEPKLTAAERSTVMAQLRRVGEVVARSSALVPIRGVAVEAVERLDLGCEHDPHPCNVPVIGAWAEVAMMGLYAEGGRVIPNRNEPPGLMVAINDPTVVFTDHALDYERLFDDRGREIYTALTEVGRVGAAVISDNNVVVLAKPGRSLTIPVSVESYLSALIKRHASERILVDIFAAELAALAPAERRRPAFVGTTEKPSRLVDEGTTGAAALVTFNPAYFDPALPRTAVQLVAIRFSYSNRYHASEPSPPEFAPDAITVWRTQHTIDYETIRLMVR